MHRGLRGDLMHRHQRIAGELELPARFQRDRTAGLPVGPLQRDDRLPFQNRFPAIARNQRLKQRTDARRSVIRDRFQ